MFPKIRTIHHWTRIHAAVLLIAIFLTVLNKSAAYFSTTGLISFAYFIYHNQKIRLEGKIMGFWSISANWITVFRLVLAAACGFIFTELHPLTIALVGLLILVLDKLDGVLARKHQVENPIGAQLDQEADAYFICIFAIILYLSGYLGMWIIILGLLRYINIIVLYLLNQQDKKEPRLRAAIVVAGLVMASIS